MLNPESDQTEPFIRLEITPSQAAFLRQLLERVDIKGYEGRAFVQLIDAIRKYPAQKEPSKITESN